MDVLQISALGAAPGAILAALISLFIQSDDNKGKHAFWQAVISFVAGFCLNLVMLLWIRPTLAGEWWGYGFLLGTGCVQSIVALLIGAATRGGKGAWEGGVGILLCFAFAIGGHIYTMETFVWNSGNAAKLASLAHIQVEPGNYTIPGPDPQHLPYVTRGVAYAKATNELGANGKNLGSDYQIDPNEATLQVICHTYGQQPKSCTLYWVLPLDFNDNSRFYFLWFGGHWGAGDPKPGYMLVNAEDSNAPVETHTEAVDQLKCYPGGQGDLDVLRRLYDHGYRSASLVDPTLEVRDVVNGVDQPPVWTVGEVRNAQVDDGPVVSDLLMMDASTCQVKEVAPDKVPADIDRVWDQDTVSSLVNLWGGYHFTSDWPNPTHTQQQKIEGDPQLLYTRDGKLVWEMTMTSYSGNDLSATGVVLFDTRTNEGQYIPLGGFAIGQHVATTCLQAPAVANKGFSVDETQIYEIDNLPTWVCTYTTPLTINGNAAGKQFQGVGLVPAFNMQGNTVIYAQDYATALQNYLQFVTSNLAANSGGKQTNTSLPDIEGGKVSEVGTQEIGGQTYYYIRLVGDPKHLYQVAAARSYWLPFVKVGDRVNMEYQDTSDGILRTVDTFHDLTLEAPRTPTPTASSSSSGAPGV